MSEADHSRSSAPRPRETAQDPLERLRHVLEGAADRRVDSPDLARHAAEPGLEHHLSTLRAHAVRGLRFERGTRILVLTAGTGLVARFLAERGAVVTALEGDPARAALARLRGEGLTNLAVVRGSLADLPEDHGYGLAVALQEPTSGSPHPLADPRWAAALRARLHPGGALLVGVDNSLGLRKLLGYRANEAELAWLGLEEDPGTGGWAGRRTLWHRLATAGFPAQRWRFPFPDHRLAVRVLAEHAYAQPDAVELVDQLVRRQVSARGDIPSLLCDERGAHRRLLAAGLGPDVANAFLVLAGPPGTDLDARWDPGEIASLATGRPQPWERERTVVATADGRRVWSRRASGKLAERGWLSQEVAPDQPYVPGPTLERLALEACARHDMAGLQRLLRQWHDALMSTAARLPSPAAVHPFLSASSTVLPSHLLDVDLDNFVVRQDGTLDYVDVEWRAREGVDAHLVQLRALWRLGRELVESGAEHPWPSVSTPDELAVSLGALIDLRVGPELLDRWRGAEAALQTAVGGGDEATWVSHYRQVGARSRHEMTRPRHIPIARLLRQLAESGAELERALAARDDLRQTLDADRAEIETLREQTRELRREGEEQAQRAAAAEAALHEERGQGSDAAHRAAEAEGALDQLRERYDALVRAHANLRTEQRRLEGRQAVRLALRVADAPVVEAAKPVLDRIGRLTRRARRAAASRAPAALRPSRGQTPSAVAVLPAAGSDPPRLDDRGLRLLESATDVTVIVPIHNAATALRRCLHALTRNTTRPCTLLLIDDASSDPEVARLLASYATRPGVRVLRNPHNLGFTGTVNRGIRESTGDVVLLNSDTEVTPRWLEGLTLAASTAPRIATVTALSNNAGAFSVPQVNQPNALPAGLDGDQTGRLVTRSARNAYPRVPTGNGFCMYIRRAALDELGLFDEEHFPRGYGEENDFCLRALKAGWENVVDDATFVVHERAASFGEEKDALIREGRAQLTRLHPDYTERVRQFLGDTGMADVRRTVSTSFARAAAGAWDDRTPTLFVLHKGGGGTPATNLDLMRGLSPRYRCHLLVSDTRGLTLSVLEKDELVELDRVEFAQRWRITDITTTEYRTIVARLLVRHRIELVHVRHLLGHTLDLPKVARALGIPVVLSFHDFYLSCPTLHLLDQDDRYCGGVCTPGQGACRLPGKRFDGTPPLKHAWVHTWRDEVGAMFESVDAFVTTSQDTRTVYRRSHPALASRRFEVIEHGRDLPHGLRLATPPQPGEAVRILVPGNLGPHKGTRLIRELKALDRRGRLEFHFLGEINADLRSCGTWHGTYEREAFFEEVRRIAPAFIGILPIWAETYCHTLTEAWAAGVPVLGSDLGAVRERLMRHGGGWLIDYRDAGRAYEQILAAADDPEAYRAQLALATLDGIRTVAQMTQDYDRLYSEVLVGRRQFGPAVEEPGPRRDAPAGNEATQRPKALR